MPSFLQGHTSILIRAFTLTPRQAKRIIEFRDALSRKAITVFYFQDVTLFWLPIYLV